MASTHRIGIVWPGPPHPADETEIARFVPDGVEWRLVWPESSRDAGAPPAITRERLEEMAKNPNIERAAARLPDMGAQSIGYGCTSASYVRGVGGDVDIIERISAATGLPATTTSTGVALALANMGVKRVAALSPHVDELNARLRVFLEGSGFVVSHMRGLNKLRGIEEIPQSEIEELVLRLVERQDADGILISCTGMRTSEILARLEAATGKPVVSALQATMWATLALAGAPTEKPGLGGLFAARAGAAL